MPPAQPNPDIHRHGGDFDAFEGRWRHWGVDSGDAAWQRALFEMSNLTDGGGRKQYTTPAIERAAAVLGVVAGANAPVRLADVARELVIPRASLFSILLSLVKVGFLERTGQTYTLGARFVELATNVRAGPSLVRISHPVLARLVARFGESAQVAVLDGNEALYVDALEGNQALRVATWVGKRNQLDSTSIGKALILDSMSEDITRLLPHLDQRARQHLEAELADMRAHGYTIDDEESEADVRCIGAPIRNAAGRIVAALSTSAPKGRLPIGRVPAVAEAVIAAADDIARGLGRIAFGVNNGEDTREVV